MVTERYSLTDEHMNSAEVRLTGEFFCATYPFLFSKNKKISIRPFEDTQGLTPPTSSRELKEVIK